MYVNALAPIDKGEYESTLCPDIRTYRVGEGSKRGGMKPSLGGRSKGTESRIGNAGYPAKSGF